MMVIKNRKCTDQNMKNNDDKFRNSADLIIKNYNDDSDQELHGSEHENYSW